jgi:hypothetical protein
MAVLRQLRLWRGTGKPEVAERERRSYRSVESLLAQPAGYIRDHVQCVPKWRLLTKFTQITALSAENVNRRPQPC